MQGIHKAALVLVCVVFTGMFAGSPAYSLDIGKSLESVTKMGEYSDKLKGLYEELMGFKDSAKFHDVGFDNCCEFAKWKDKVTGLTKEAKTPVEEKASSSLAQLGEEYLKTKGAENDTTSSLTSIIKGVLGK
ncbi:MAG: hypothetical protein HY788_23350 [Deltaproteobacteria bacterium]|nr:hypothetical protein [Deltaproteobacteria bacterium]